MASNCEIYRAWNRLWPNGDAIQATASGTEEKHGKKLGITGAQAEIRKEYLSNSNLGHYC
jgi:hypothetical protein